MDNFFNGIKNCIVMIISFLMSYFAPIEDLVFTIFFIFLVNCVVGMISGIVVSGEGFSFKKFTRCLFETFAFYAIVVCAFVIGKHVGNMDGAMHVIGGVVYAIIYFSGVNILRNLTLLFPDSKTLLFLYWIVSFECLKKIPILKRFDDFNKKKENEKD